MPKRLETIEEAREALKRDRLGTAYITLDSVFVATKFGTGTFSREEWKQAEAQEEL